jgi:hypothetical protein
LSRESILTRMRYPDSITIDLQQDRRQRDCFQPRKAVFDDRGRLKDFPRFSLFVHPLRIGNATQAIFFAGESGKQGRPIRGNWQEPINVSLSIKPKGGEP